MPPWNRREFVALGVGTITAAITQNFRAATASNSKIRAAVLGIEHAHAAGKTKVTQDRDRLFVSNDVPHIPPSMT
jgi:hypothetical protein